MIAIRQEWAYGRQIAQWQGWGRCVATERFKKLRTEWFRINGECRAVKRRGPEMTRGEQWYIPDIQAIAELLT